MYVGDLLKSLQRSELDLAKEYRAVGERHAVEHEVFHTAHTLAKQCEAHVNAVAPFVERYGKTPKETEEGPGAWESLMAGVRRKMSETIGRRPEPGILLLRDLRQLLLSATEVKADWVMAGQVAQVLRDTELLAIVTECDTEITRQIRWLNTRIKESSAQVLTVG